MIRFSSVNQVKSLNHNPNYQRHHLIPMQAKSESKLDEMFRILVEGGFDLDDFRQNGILLPCCEKEVLRTGRPLHRGPHPRYNELVIERLAQISQTCKNIDDHRVRFSCIHFRTLLLQRGLRYGLANGGFVRIHLNSRDPLRSTVNFSAIDSRIDQLYNNTKQLMPNRANFSLKSYSDTGHYLAEL